jgi:single-strand DNA-binding protein
MANFNKVLLLGNLTRDPQLSYTPNQTAVVDFGVATNRRWTGQDGSQREETCFVDCRAYGKTAENINKYLSKGHPVFLEGRLVFEQWTSQEDVKHYKLRVVIETIQFLPKNNGGGDQANDETAGAETSPEPQGAGGRRSREPMPDSEIPF